MNKTQQTVQELNFIILLSFTQLELLENPLIPYQAPLHDQVLTQFTESE